MAATTTPSTPWLVKLLQKDYPAYSFVSATDFSWQPATSTIEFSATEFNDGLLLHELAHALLQHADYRRDVELVRLETAAWTKARELAAKYSVEIEPERIDNHLDTYRDWLHARSTCPNCQSSGVQISGDSYQCPACSSIWQVNEARHCQLRRKLIK